MRFLIVDGYPAASRDELCCAGVAPAHELFARMLQDYLPGATSEWTSVEVNLSASAINERRAANRQVLERS